MKLGMATLAMGRPSKLTPETRAQAEILAKVGFTDEQIAEALEVHVSTIHRWKKREPEFAQALSHAKLQADSQVVQALYRRAVGYDYPHTITLMGKNGPVKSVITKHHPPCVRACIFWLINRLPEKWSRNPKPRRPGGEDLGGELLQMLMDAQHKPKGRSSCGPGQSTVTSTR
jgi:hypothetical protein